MCACLCVLPRRPLRWTYSAQIWHGGPHLGDTFRFGTLEPRGQRVVLEIHAAQKVHFSKNIIKQKRGAYLKMGGQIWSDQVLDLTQVSARQAKCKGGFCTNGPLAI